MKNSSKVIEFYPNFEGVERFSEPPTPAIHANIPQWFKEASRYKNNDEKFDVYDGENNLTIRHCIPLLEGFTSGYVMTLYRDVLVKYVNGRHVVTWINQGSEMPPAIKLRPQYEEKPENKSFPQMEGYEKAEFNWMPYWSIKTPPGYSCLFTHPINRIDLPFYTLGGVMDTDKWGDAGNHPFLLKKRWEGVIEKGTPMFQFIPFKRDDWEKSVRNDMTAEYSKKLALRDSVLRGFYKKNSWSTKKYR